MAKAELLEVYAKELNYYGSISRQDHRQILLFLLLQRLAGRATAQKKCGFKFARDAKAAERDFLNQQYGASCMSFKALYELYIADCRARLKESTVISKDSLFQHSILPFFRDSTI